VEKDEVDSVMNINTSSTCQDKVILPNQTVMTSNYDLREDDTSQSNKNDYTLKESDEKLISCSLVLTVLLAYHQCLGKVKSTVNVCFCCCSILTLNIIHTIHVHCCYLAQIVFMAILELDLLVSNMLHSRRVQANKETFIKGSTLVIEFMKMKAQCELTSSTISEQH